MLDAFFIYFYYFYYFNHSILKITNSIHNLISLCTLKIVLTSKTKLSSKKPGSYKYSKLHSNTFVPHLAIESDWHIT